MFPRDFFGEFFMLDVRIELNENTCYVKPTVINGVLWYALHAHDGYPMTVFDNRELAFCTARQHDLKPMSLH